MTNYEGVFASAGLPLKITVKLSDGKLTAQATGQPAFNLTPYSSSEFRFDPAGVEILFSTEGDKVDYGTFTLKQGGGSFKFTRE